MKLDEYKQKMTEETDWAPGWAAIDASLEKIYGKVEPKHYATNLVSRAVLGGNEYLDGYSIYQSSQDQPHLHLVTYGMSELYPNEESFAGEFSKWGYEMTIRLLDTGEEPIWAMNMLGNLARYTFIQKKWFENNQFVLGDGSPIQQGSNSKITSLLIVEDPELSAINTVHGRLEFLQMVGVTWEEITAVRENLANLQIIIDNMKKDSPLLITDMKRTKSYL